MTPRLLQAMSGAAQGGAEAFFERLAIALHRAGIAQRLLIRRDAERAARLRGAGLDVVELGFRGPLDLVTRHRFGREIRGFRPGVVLTWMNRASAACPRSDGSFIHAARLGGYYKLKYYRRASHLIGNTKGIRDYLIGQGWPAARAHYIPNFVDAASATAISRAEFDTPADVPLVLGLGRLHRNKAFDVLIEAVARLPRAHLWLAGAGPLENELKSRAATAGIASRTHFLGWRRDVAALLATCDVFVCSSRVEPLGNVVLEAWAAKRPVIAAAAEGPREIMVDGASGLLVPIDDAPALAAAIDRVLADTAFAARLASGGKDAYDAEFTEAAVVKRYLDFFQAIAPCAASPG
ncbi:MAG: glycosyltransferase [Alphaproteobacteria bacterium]|nr:glycosyltransferase [Alphaproteobacteria bacterium]